MAKQWKLMLRLYSLFILGYTPMHLAVLNEHFSCVKELREAGANVDAPDGRSGCTALHHAVEANDHAIAGYLLIEVSLPVGHEKLVIQGKSGNLKNCLECQGNWSCLRKQCWLFFVILFYFLRHNISIPSLAFGTKKIVSTQPRFLHVNKEYRSWLRNTASLKSWRRWSYSLKN